MRGKLRFREIKKFTPYSTVGQWQRLNFSRVLNCKSHVLFYYTQVCKKSSPCLTQISVLFAIKYKPWPARQSDCELGSPFQMVAALRIQAWDYLWLEYSSFRWDSEGFISLCALWVAFSWEPLNGVLFKVVFVAHLRQGLVVYWVLFTDLVGGQGSHFNFLFLERAWRRPPDEENTKLWWEGLQNNVKFHYNITRISVTQSSNANNNNNNNNNNKN